MPRLKDRNKQTPGGHKFYDAILKYRARPWASVEEIAAGLVSARKANPALTQQHGWSTDEVTVRNEVDEAIALHCQQMGWHGYLADGGQPAPVPFRQTHQNQRFLGRLKNAAGAVKMFVDFGLTKEEAVPITKATQRAEICITCPFNEKPKSWLDHFTTSASEGIRLSFEKLKGWNLKVPHEDKLGMCTVCFCPLGLKTFFPIERIVPQLTDEMKAHLPAHCWIKIEGDIK